jgi:hypothetical protein
MISTLVALSVAWDWWRASFARPPLPLGDAERFAQCRHAMEECRPKPANLHELFPLADIFPTIPPKPIISVTTDNITYSVSLAVDPSSISRKEVARAIKRSAKITEECWANRGDTIGAIQFMATHLRQTLDLKADHGP